MGSGGGGNGGGGPETHIKLADPDEATYFGRVHKTFHMLDFRTALTTDHALQDALKLVAAKGAAVRLLLLLVCCMLTIFSMHRRWRSSRC